MEIEGKRILLSGATGGLGRAIAEELAGRGAKLVLSSRREKELKELARKLPGGARRHKVIVCDLAEAGAAVKLVADAGDIDGFVANAALPASGRLEGYSTRDVGRALQVNLEAPVMMAHHVVPKLLEKGEGHLVFIASLSGVAPAPRSSLYAATKFGLRGFALGLREDLRSSGVGVSLVTPGFVRDAGMLADSGAGAPPGMGTTTPRKVARATVRAIRKDRSEIAVAPWHQIRLVKFAGRHPEIAGKVTNGRADRLAAAVTDGQTDKR